ncbi:hypothetical protein [Lacinutrix sp. MedPE-SW]|uniref:hypothetical protein n=1 Tax=Lacinutrix sp. MedPE-SW TaxID=1860087 RepID=UPI00091EED87|nr:hypothetical protein [Lacinutrix sp. MedPE-SW]OIQ17377.1 MAG: hypothetical protein BM549_12880 [Lacinutrix sp. MedPE-SW]
MLNNTFLNIKKFILSNRVLISIYCICFLYLIFQDAIYSPDTASHFRLEIWRSPVYSLFVYIFNIIFKTNFNMVTVAFQLILGFSAVHVFYKKISDLLQLPKIAKALFLIVLIVPYFNPLIVGNNICSEGFSYPLYLLTLCFGFSFIIENKNFWYLLITSIILSLTRAQFLLLPIIFSFVYILKFRKTFKKTKQNTLLFLLIFSLVFNVLVDKVYHKITKDQFASTSSFFIANTAAIYVSKAEDIKDLKTEETKAVFNLSRTYSEEKGWLMDHTKTKSASELYNDFHSNLTKICSYAYHYKGSAYLKENKNYTLNKARVQVEKAAKNMMPVLVFNNYKNYFKLYYGNLIHGIKSKLLLLFVIVLLFISIVQLFKAYTKDYAIVFLLSSLILSNALIVSFGSYSIVRLLFYHYALILLLLFYVSRMVFTKYKTS